MAIIYVEDIEVNVGPFQEKSDGITISGLGGKGTKSYCQISLSSLTAGMYR